MTTMGSPEPRSMMFIRCNEPRRHGEHGAPKSPCPSCLRGPSSSTLVPQWFSGLQRVLDSFLRLPFGDKAEKSLAFEIQQILLANRGGMGQRSSSHDRGELSADDRVVVADAPGTPGE